MGVLKPPRAMILAAGFGSRLGGLSALRPKPMLPVCGAPLVRWSVLWLRRQGIRDIVVNLHHKGEQIEAELGDGRALDVDIAYSREEGEILGTGGGLRRARPLLDDGRGSPFVVVNGKLLTDLELAPVLAAHRRGALATLVLRADPDATRWGSLELGEDDRVVRLLGARPRDSPERPSRSPPLMFTGIHVLQPEVLDRVPAEGPQCIVRTAYREMFHRGEALHGFVSDAYWWEHSTPERYLQGVFNVLDGRVRLPPAPDRPTGVGPGARMHPGAEIRPPVWIDPSAIVEEGARIGPHVQLGAGARVRTGVALERCIVWDRVDVRRSVKDEVLTVPTEASDSL